MQTKDQLIALAKQIAASYALDPAIVCGICERESSWNTLEIRYEDGFFEKWIRPMTESGAVTDKTEARARAISWGLMQIMGQSARLRGYHGSFAGLCADPGLGINYGCRHFKAYLDADGGNVEEALQHYNGGSNQNYSNEVLVLAKAYQ